MGINGWAIEAIVGLQHGDLNTNNILAKFSEDGQNLTGYYLIDLRSSRKRCLCFTTSVTSRCCT